MNITELKDKCKKGFTGKIPGWYGYVDYDYATGLLYFHNKEYRLSESKLFEVLDKRNDLYYII